MCHPHVVYKKHPSARLGLLLENMAVEQRLLLIGSSHFTRLQDYIHHSPEAANGLKYLFVSRGGLTAAEGLDFVMRHDTQIARFSPTHAVIHLGGNDVMNREQKLPLGNFGQAIKNLKALGAWLVAGYNVEVHYSEFLPHARYPCPQGQKLPDWMFERNKFRPTSYAKLEFYETAFQKVVGTSPEQRRKRTDVGKHHENLHLNSICPAISGSFKSHHNFQRYNLSCCCKSHVIIYIHLSKTSLFVHIKWKKHWNLS